MLSFLTNAVLYSAVYMIQHPKSDASMQPYFQSCKVPEHRFIKIGLYMTGANNVTKDHYLPHFSSGIQSAE